MKTLTVFTLLISVSICSAQIKPLIKTYLGDEQLFTNGDHNSRIYLLEILESEEKLPRFLIEKMAPALAEMNNYEELNLFLNLLEKHAYSSPLILSSASVILENKNSFIARRAYWYLEKQTLDKQTTNRIQTFREKSIKQGLNLQALK